MARLLEEIVSHKFIETNGVQLHYVEAGSGPTVLLLHGFPDFWYGFRHLIPTLVDAGYHVVAPDYRGFGQSDIPESSDLYTSLHIVGDIIGLLDALDVKQALVVGHDWGSVYGTDLLLFRPDRVKALVLMAVPYFPRHPSASALDMFHGLMGDDLYIYVFQKPGVAEAIFKTAKNKDIMSAFMLRWTDNKGLVVPPFIEDEPLPDWLTEEELTVYDKAFEKSGWGGAFNHYRAITLSWKLKAAWTNAPLPASIPVMMVLGRKDVSVTISGIKTEADEKAYGEGCRQSIPSLKDIHFVDAGHFVHQEKSEEVNKYVLDFLQQYQQ